MVLSIRRRITDEMSGAALPFVAFCIALNLSAGQITAALKIPLYLDSIGTVLVAVLVGPWAAVICGSAANLLAAAFGNPSMMFFIPVVAVIGAFTGFLARREWFRTWYLVALGGLLQGILAAIVSAPISAYLFSGVMMAGTDFVVLYFRSVGNTLLNSVLYQGLTSDPADKLVTYLIVFFLTKNLPQRLVSRLRGASNLRVPDKTT
ncbi:MAG: energy-coupling factor ABC transporter permease [Ignavibacteriales bacterium]|nr:energy-coupling factor ABC transporter permease [Ignavibacteriales bacterium]